MFVLDIYSDVTRIAVSRAFGGHILGASRRSYRFGGNMTACHFWDPVYASFHDRRRRWGLCRLLYTRL